MKRVLLTLLVILASTVPAVHAGLDIDLGAAIRMGDDHDLFLAVSARYFDRDRAAIDRVAVRYRNSDDVAVALHLARHSDRSPDRIFAMRARGLSWWDVSVRLGLPMEVWFVPVRRDPGPPYGKAYGHWKHRKLDRHHVVVLSDAELRDLVAVRVLHEYYGVSVDTAMEWRASGRDLRTLVAGEYHRRHGHKHPAVAVGKTKQVRHKNKHRR